MEIESELFQIKRLYETMSKEVQRVKQKSAQATDEKEATLVEKQHLKSQLLEAQLQLVQANQSLQDHSKLLQDSESEKQSLLEKFELFGKHLKQSNDMAVDSLQQSH